MAVKASASITLSSIVDIQATYRYYKLQASTAAKPTVPTVHPPTGWTDTEPTYTSGSTNTLYTVDCTVFTNGTFSYTPVSKSSSYEAAKEAYNKAVAAGDTAAGAQDAVVGLAERVTTNETNISWNTEQIGLRATKTEVETGDTSVKDTLQAELKVLSDGVEIDLTATTEKISNVDASLNEMKKEYSKRFSFTESGMEIGGVDSAYTMQLDNEAGLVILKNGVVRSKLTDNDFETGSISLAKGEYAKFGGLRADIFDGAIVWMEDE